MTNVLRTKKLMQLGNFECRHQTSWINPVCHFCAPSQKLSQGWPLEISLLKIIHNLSRLRIAIELENIDLTLKACHFVESNLRFRLLSL